MVPYKPLAAVAEIRLLHLHPGSDDEPITCHFEHVNTLHHPQFEALSYMWGSKDSTKAIKVNGAIFDIRENLWQALKHVRLANWVRVLWIDALCINQDDINERNNQVSQMGNIYARSKGVVAWLGLSDDSSRAAMDFFIRFKPGLPETRYSNGLHETRPLVIDAKTISAISLFCDKEYWTRLWIIQEVVVSKQVTLICGNLWCSWSQFELFFQTAHERKVMQNYKSKWEMDSKFASIGKSNAWNLVQERKLFESRPPRPLVHLCIDYGNSKCQDARDKVFGLLAFTLPCCRNALPVNYSSALSEISSKLLFHYMDTDYSADHLLNGTNALLIGYAQDLHLSLNLTKDDLEDSVSSSNLTLEEGTALKDRALNANAYARGRISYVSPLLNYDIVSIKSMELPDMAFPSILQPHKPDCKHATTWKGDLRCAGQLDVVSPLSGGLSWFKSKKSKSHEKKGFWDRKLTGRRRKGFEADGSALAFQEAISLAKAAVSVASLGACRLAVDEFGLMFFAPTETKVDDYVCQAIDSDILLICRERSASKLDCELVGRGLNVFQTLRLKESSPNCSCGKEPEQQREPVAFNMSMSTLQRLTIAPRQPLLSDKKVKRIEWVLDIPPERRYFPQYWRFLVDK